MAEQLDEQLKVTLKAPPVAAQPQTIGNYQIIRLLGKGGMGAVYEVEHKLLQQKFALKILSPERIPDATLVERFRAEAKAISALQHRGLLRIFEFGVSEPGQPFFVTELFDGAPISQIVHEKGELSTSLIAQIMHQSAGALAHAHERGVVHRDIKPSNILVKEDHGVAEVKIIDFGIAKQQEQGDGVAPPTLTATGEILGTPQYMSPEQCQGVRLDARSDIYSLGCVLYQMLTGSPPFDSENIMAIMMQHMTEPPKEIQTTDRVRKSLGAIAMRCLAKDRDTRYQSMDDLIADLNAVAEGATIKPHKFTRSKGSFKDRLRIYIPLALLAMVASFIAASYTLWAPAVVLHMNLPPAVAQMIMDPNQAEALQAENEADRLRNSCVRADGSLDMAKLQLAENILRPSTIGSKPWNMKATLQLANILAIEGKIEEAKTLVNNAAHQDALTYATYLHNVGVSLDQGGFHAAAWPLMRESHALFQELVGDNDPRTVKELWNMASADYFVNQSRALQEFKRVLPKLKYWNPQLEENARYAIDDLEKQIGPGNNPRTDQK